MQEFKALASQLADAAGEIVREHFRTGFEVITKADDSPVTIADRAIEKRMREMIEDARPDDGIFGEEFGIKEGSSGLTWVLDPIDGTKSFVIGRPTFGTLIALAEEDVPVLGIIDQAVLGERWIGVRGEETMFNSSAVQVKPSSAMRIGSTSPSMFKDCPEILDALEGDCKITWGGDCYMYGLLASGYMDSIIEARLSPYDFMALVPVVQGAGGIMSDWDGNDLKITSDGRVLASASQALHDQHLMILS